MSSDTTGRTVLFEELSSSLKESTLSPENGERILNSEEDTQFRGDVGSLGWFVNQ